MMGIEEVEENDFITFDGFDAAIIGHGTQFSTNLIIYDYKKCLEIRVSRDGMEWVEAEEYMSFNVIGAWVGKNTPVFLYGTGKP